MLGVVAHLIAHHLRHMLARGGFALMRRLPQQICAVDELAEDVVRDEKDVLLVGLVLNVRRRVGVRLQRSRVGGVERLDDAQAVRLAIGQLRVARAACGALAIDICWKAKLSFAHAYQLVKSSGPLAEPQGRDF